MIEALSESGYDEAKLDELVSRIGGMPDTVTVEQLAAAGAPNKLIFGLRRKTLSVRYRSCAVLLFGLQY